MKIFILTLLVISQLGGSNVAFARLGETEQEITARYGTGTKVAPRFPNTTNMRYSKNGFKIYVCFLEGKSFREQFCYDIPVKWSDEAIEKFIKALSPDESWTYSKRNRLWYRNNKAVIVRREPGHEDWLIIEDRAAMKKIDESKTKGF